MNLEAGSKLYFDITDIIDYGARQNRVSGIQRVVINVICNLSAQYGKERVRCVFLNRKTGALAETDASDLMYGSEFDPDRMRYKLRIYLSWKGFPDRKHIKAYLLPLREQGRELLRLVRKADIYLSSVLYPKRLKRFGLQRTCDRYPDEQQVSVVKLRSLNATDSLVMLGINWRCDPMLELARRHRQAGGDVVQMVYDLIPHKFPQYFLPAQKAAYDTWLENVQQICSRFLCISECTAADLRSYLSGLRPTIGITVIPLAHEVCGYSRNAQIHETTSRVAALVSRPFVLCVGTLEVRKNGTLLLQAWARLEAELKDRLPRLVFAGRRGWLIDEFDRLLTDNPALQRYIEFIDGPSDQELAMLYSRCQFTVYPSMYEGWGLPVGESAWFGKYCIASNASSIPEVCGDLIDYCAPDDLDGFVQKLRQAICDHGYVQEREVRIAAAALRTWHQVAEDISQTLMAAPREKC